MVLEQILITLKESQVEHRLAVELGRLAFLEWLVSLPIDRDITQQAMLAYEQAVPLKPVSPAIAVFCDLLIEAAQAPPKPLNQPSHGLDRRRGSRRRTLH